MAKIEQIKSRAAKSEATALADDDEQDAFYRPATPSNPRADIGPGAVPRYQPDRPEQDQQEEAFLRARRRVPVRKAFLPRTRLGQISLAAAVLAALTGTVVLAIAARNMLKHDPRFRIDTSESIQILGNSEVTRGELLSVFGSDIGRNVFFVPLGERRAALEGLPWVEHATVMRLLPNQLRVAIVERVPVAFVRTGNEIGLVDASGVLLNMTPGEMAAKHYSFPVVTGIEAGDPLSTRTARMHIYQRFLTALDAAGENNSAQLSEVDLSDPEDVKAVVASPGPGSGDLLLHFGDQDFLARFRNYQAHLAEWRQQYPHLASVDLRYDRQVVLEMDKNAAPASPSEVSPSVSANGGTQEKANPLVGRDDGVLPSAKAAHLVHPGGAKPLKKQPLKIARHPLSNAAAYPAPYKESYPAAHPAPPPASANEVPK